jgi:transcription antitermination factor NusG
VLTLPTAAGGRRDRISPSRGLDAELSRRERRGETLFEYFAPSYVEVRKVDGKLVNTRRPLLFNYVFIRSSVEEIFRMKQTLPLYNFLPRVSSGGTPHFPYLSDSEMGNLRWVAESYSNELPVYVPDSGRLLKGDRVRITSGYFAGMEAEVVIQPGGGHKDVMARILDCMWVPLLEVKPGEYELIELNTNGKHVYTHLDNDRLRDGLHDALGRYHASGSVGEEDTRLAREVLRAYGSLRDALQGLFVAPFRLQATGRKRRVRSFARHDARYAPGGESSAIPCLVACDALRLHGQQSLPSDGARGCGSVAK